MHDPQSLIGRVLHQSYRLEKLIGSGGMGAVFEASHARLNRRYAIKLLFAELEESEEMTQRFRREANVCAELRHANVVEVFDYNLTEDGHPYIVMELLEGQDLSQRLKRGAISPGQAVDIAKQICSALDAVHRRGVIHRDLKPHNVWLCADGGVKVLDFGISKDLAAETKITQTTATIGTPQYMAPEQATGDSATADARSDIYAVGTILFECITGRVPFRAASVPSLLYKVVYEQPDLSVLESKIGERLQAIIRRCLAKDPVQRFQTAAGLSAAFDSDEDVALLDTLSPESVAGSVIEGAAAASDAPAGTARTMVAPESLAADRTMLAPESVASDHTMLAPESIAANEAVAREEAATTQGVHRSRKPMPIAIWLALAAVVGGGVALLVARQFMTGSPDDNTVQTNRLAAGATSTKAGGNQPKGEAPVTADAQAPTKPGADARATIARGGKATKKPHSKLGAKLRTSRKRPAVKTAGGQATTGEQATTGARPTTGGQPAASPKPVVSSKAPKPDKPEKATRRKLGREVFVTVLPYKADSTDRVYGAMVYAVGGGKRRLLGKGAIRDKPAFVGEVLVIEHPQYRVGKKRVSARDGDQPKYKVTLIPKQRTCMKLYVTDTVTGALVDPVVTVGQTVIRDPILNKRKRPNQIAVKPGLQKVWVSWRNHKSAYKMVRFRPGVCPTKVRITVSPRKK